MPGGRGVSERDRWVVVACAGVALLFAVGVPLFSAAYVGVGGVELDLVVRVLLGLVPLSAALAALVLTRIPGVGLGIAATAAVVGSVVGIGSFLLIARRGTPGLGFAIAPLDVVAWVAWAVLGSLALVPAELVARGRRSFTAVTGTLTGLVVALTSIVLETLPTLVQPDRLSALPASYWIGVLVAPLVALTATGAVAGTIVERERDPVRPEGPV